MANSLPPVTNQTNQPVVVVNKPCEERIFFADGKNSYPNTTQGGGRYGEICISTGVWKQQGFTGNLVEADRVKVETCAKSEAARGVLDQPKPLFRTQEHGESLFYRHVSLLARELTDYEYSSLSHDYNFYVGGAPQGMSRYIKLVIGDSYFPLMGATAVDGDAQIASTRKVEIYQPLDSCAWFVSALIDSIPKTE